MQQVDANNFPGITRQKGTERSAESVSESTTMGTETADAAGTGSSVKAHKYNSLNVGETVSAQNKEASHPTPNRKTKRSQRFKAGLVRTGRRITAEVFGEEIQKRTSPVPAGGRVFNSESGTGSLSAAPRKMQFTEKNTPFQNNVYLNRQMRRHYEGILRSLPPEEHQEISNVAERYFGIGTKSGPETRSPDSTPDPRSLGANHSRFLDVQFRPKVPKGTTAADAETLRREALSGNPVHEGATSMSLGTLLTEPIRIKTTHFDSNGIDQLVGDTGEARRDGLPGTEKHNPLEAHLVGQIRKQELLHTTLKGLSDHPAIKLNSEGEVDWTPEATQVVREAADKLRKGGYDLVHGNGMTMPNGTHFKSTKESNHWAGLSDHLQEHWEPVPGHEKAAAEFHQAAHNTSVGTDIHSLLETRANPLKNTFDLSLDREALNSDDKVLKHVIQTHKGQPFHGSAEAVPPTDSLEHDTRYLQTLVGARKRTAPDSTADSLRGLLKEKNYQTPWVDTTAPPRSKPIPGEEEYLEPVVKPERDVVPAVAPGSRPNRTYRSPESFTPEELGQVLPTDAEGMRVHPEKKRFQQQGLIPEGMMTQRVPDAKPFSTTVSPEGTRPTVDPVAQKPTKKFTPIIPKTTESDELGAEPRILTHEEQQGTGKYQLTPAAVEKLADEHQSLTSQRKTLSDTIGAAAREGDLSENGGYHAAREQQGKNEARIQQLSGILSDYRKIRPNPDTSKVDIGHTVKLQYPGESESEAQKYLVGSSENSTPDLSVVSPDSEVGKQIKGKAVGEHVEFTSPSGKQKAKILSIE